MTSQLIRIAVLALAALCPTMTPAQYPVRPIKILVPIPPGGAPDIVARVIGQKLAESLGQQIVVENRTGSNGNIAGDLVAKSPADGYTLLLAQDSLFAIRCFAFTVGSPTCAYSQSSRSSRSHTSRYRIRSSNG